MDPSKQTAFKDEAVVLENPFLFWKRQLDVNRPQIEIPSDFPRSSATKWRIGQVPFSLAEPCYNSFKQLSEQQNTTLFTTLLAVYNTLLFRYTKQENIVIGSPSFENIFNDAGKLADTRHNTKIFRTDISANPRFVDLLKQVHQEVLTVNEQKAMPYESLEEAMKLDFGINYAGLYNVVFSFSDSGFASNEVNYHAANICTPENPGPAIDLALYIEDTGQGLNGVWTYNAALFEAGTIRRLAGHFEILLESIVSAPQQTIAHLQILTDKEHHQLTSEWNCSMISYPANKCIHELFEEQFIKTPGAIALVFEGSELTYKELNEYANRLAHYLCSKGVKKETLVPICTVRSLEMIIAILGILKAGGGYVPIDPGYPLERIAYMLEDTGASLMVCSKESKARLKTFQNIDLIELTGKNSFLKNQPVTNLNLDINSGNLAYIIYTSGSTGKPKGVMIEHRALADHCYGVIESANLKICKSFALFSPLVFDAGHSIIHSCFIIGAALHVLSEELILNSEKVATYIDDNAIDCIKIVPSLWLSYANLQNTVLSKKAIIFGGEAFHLNILNYLIKSDYGGVVYNHYGPTEVTIGKCIYKVATNRPYYSVPIGKPFSNTQLYVLDDYFQLTPAGLEGELYVAGDGLARGYLNQPGLTTEKFILNPIATQLGGRMYKTGDKVRWLADGNIEYLGRADDQVKIQGHRIESGEIEDALLKSGLARQAVVLANDDKSGNKHLVAYVVPAEQYNKEALIAFLNKKLPDYMVPAKYIELENLPLTTNGKINKEVLKKLEEAGKQHTDAKNEIEKKLVDIWQDMLKTAPIGVHDDFFELGGNSIHAVMMLAKIKRIFHKNFPLAIFFRARTIYRLAAEIKSATEDLSVYSSLVPIQPYGTKTPLFAAHAGLGDVVFYQNLSHHLGPDQPFYGLQAKGINSIEAPSSQMEQMAAYYVSLIRKVQPEGPYYLAGYCLGSRISFEMAQQLTSQGQNVALLANFNGISPTYRRTPDTINTNNSIRNEIPLGRFAKTSHRLRRFAKLSLKEKVSRIADIFMHKIVFKVIKLFLVLRFKLSEFVFNFYLRRKQKAPAIFTRIYVAISLHKLQLKYKPKAYQGPMVVFRSPGIFTDPYLGWKNFVTGEIKTFDIPGEHETRRDIMNEPHVQLLAKQLEPFLDN